MKNRGKRTEVDLDVVPRVSGKEAVILRLLVGGGEMYGLQIVEESEGKLKPGTVYVTLSRMEDKGLVESWPEDRRPGVAGLPRRLYRPTGLGQRVLKAWKMVAAAARLEFA